MAEVLDCTEGVQWSPALRTARQAVGVGNLAVIPTDTVYGIAADAFSPGAVQALLDAKGRTRQSPPPVLVADIAGVAALAASTTSVFDALAERFWPGALTIIVESQPALQWDLGDTQGTVGLRIPDLELTRELLRDTGPLACSSANLTGEPAATTVAEAQAMLGDSVAVYLDGGRCNTQRPSTIVDLTDLDMETPLVRVVRKGSIGMDDIIDVVASAEPAAEVSYVPAPPARRREDPSA